MLALLLEKYAYEVETHRLLNLAAAKLPVELAETTYKMAEPKNVWEEQRMEKAIRDLREHVEHWGLKKHVEKRAARLLSRMDYQIDVFTRQAIASLEGAYAELLAAQGGGRSGSGGSSGDDATYAALKLGNSLAQLMGPGTQDWTVSCGPGGHFYTAAAASAQGLGSDLIYLIPHSNPVLAAALFTFRYDQQTDSLVHAPAKIPASSAVGGSRLGRYAPIFQEARAELTAQEASRRPDGPDAYPPPPPGSHCVYLRPLLKDAEWEQVAKRQAEADTAHDTALLLAAAAIDGDDLDGGAPLGRVVSAQHRFVICLSLRVHGDVRCFLCLSFTDEAVSVAAFGRPEARAAR